MTFERNNAIAIAKLSDWLENLAPVFHPLISTTFFFLRFEQVTG